MQIDQILVPTDFSDNAGHALEYAIELAKRSSAELHLLHTPVVPAYLLMDLSYSPGPEAVTRILNEAQDAIEQQAEAVSAAGLVAHTAIREGLVHEVIRDYAHEHRSDLIVMGSHGRAGVSKLMYGSVTERSIKTAHKPIIVVPPKGGRLPSDIVVGYDFSGPSAAAAEAGRAIQTLCEGSLHLVHAYLDVWGEYTDRGAVVGEAAERRREALQAGLQGMLEDEARRILGGEPEQVETHLVTGDPAGALLKAAENVGATLICVGTTGKSGLERILIGSVARRLLHHAHVPVLLTHDNN